MTLGDKIRFTQPVPSELDVMRSNIIARATKLASIKSQVTALQTNVNQWLACACRISQRINPPLPSPGSGSRPYDWHRRQANPRTLKYNSYIVNTWLDEGGLWLGAPDWQQGTPDWLAFGGNGVIRLEPGRWYAVQPVNWPNGHHWIVDPVFASFSFSDQESGIKYVYIDDVLAGTFNLWLYSPDHIPPNGTAYAIYAAVP